MGLSGYRSQFLQLLLWRIRHLSGNQAQGSGNRRVPWPQGPCLPHSLPHPPLRDDVSHLGCCRFEPQVSVTPDCLIGMWHPQVAGACRPGKECSPNKNKPATFFGSPLPLPALQPSILTAEPAREGRERESRVEEVLLQSNPEKERERGREEEKERERSPYMGTCADNVWQWLRGQQRSDTRQMEEIKHGTESVPGPWKQLLFHSEFAQNLAHFPF